MPENQQVAGFSPGYRSYVLFVLTLIYVVNYLDRQILGILLPYIQKEFTMDDFQAGLLSGTVFAVIYATLSIPLATLADRMSRRNIIAASLATFSLMTVLSGYTTKIWQLARHALLHRRRRGGHRPFDQLDDRRPLSAAETRRRARVLFRRTQHRPAVRILRRRLDAAAFGWRSAFIASGAPGLLLVFLLLLTVHEPSARRGGQHRRYIAMRRASGKSSASCGQQRSFRWIALGCSTAARSAVMPISTSCRSF